MTKSAQTVEETLSRLEEIVKSLEGEDVELEKSLELFEEGVRLAGALKSKLEESELRVKKILESSDGFDVTEFDA